MNASALLPGCLCVIRFLEPDKVNSSPTVVKQEEEALRENLSNHWIFFVTIQNVSAILNRPRVKYSCSVAAVQIHSQGTALEEFLTVGLVRITEDKMNRYAGIITKDITFPVFDCVIALAWRKLELKQKYLTSTNESSGCKSLSEWCRAV